MATMTSGDNRYIVFSIAHSMVALPIGRVLRVIRNQMVLRNEAAQAVPTGELHSMGLLQVGRRMIRVLNLEPLFLSTSSTLTHLRPEESIPLSNPVTLSPETSAPKFFVITKTRHNDLCGIPTTTPPNLFNLPPDQLQPLPSSWQDNADQQISHFVTLTDTDTPSTIFLLHL